MDVKRPECKVVKRAAIITIVVVVLLAAFLLIWTCAAERQVHYTPDYPRVDLAPYLEKEKLTEEEYEILFRQTGLSQLAVDALLSKDTILAAQDRFFAEVEISCEYDFPVFREHLVNAEQSGDAGSERASHKTKETTAQPTLMPALENGDILITFSTHFFGWRNGHAAIVIDSAKGRILEALTLGTNSGIRSVDAWADCPSFAVLRLADASKEERAEIADYAKQELLDLPYSLTVGLAPANREQKELAATHCAHLIWYAYNRFGYDLDSDGGVIVTPKDLYDSPLLEVVQVYGIEP